MGRPKSTALTNPLINTNGSITARPCSVRDLQMVYGISYKTMRSWLKPFAEEIGIRNTYLFTILQVETIFKKLGTPKFYDFDKYSEEEK